MLPNPLEEIARKLDDYNKRLSHLERLEGGGNVPPFWLPSTLFKDVNGTPQSASIQWGGVIPRWNVWRFSSGDFDYVATNFLLPSYYNGEDITITTYWCKEDAGAGDWRQIIETVAVDTGETINAGGTQVTLSITTTVPAIQFELTTTETIAVAPAFEAGDLLLIMEGRAGPAGADTYGGDILFLGMEIDW